mmetsp:Transcript_14315/g.38826  ORF Transcript_14315/g.38826 Transcript_14315/m.38826 type:complete len:226 (-) Transcript_14315:96-773(-)
MDDGGALLLGICVHRVPHLSYPGAGGIHDVHTLVPEKLHVIGGHTKSREDDHIPIINLAVVLALLGILLHNVHIHLSQAPVHFRVVNDFVGDMNVAAWECPARLVGHAHSPLHAPAVAVRLGQLDSDIALLPKVTLLPHLRHQPGQRITHAVRIQRLLTLGIVVDRPDVAARLAEGPTNCATLLLLLRCGFLLLRGCLISHCCPHTQAASARYAVAGLRVSGWQA